MRKLVKPSVGRSGRAKVVPKLVPLKPPGAPLELVPLNPPGTPLVPVLLKTDDMEIDVENIRTPQEWHEEHLVFMSNAGTLYSSEEKPDELEAACYFEHAFCRFAPVCTHCLEYLPWLGKLFGAPIRCSQCGESSTGEQALVAAFNILLGRKHVNCCLSDEEFQARWGNVTPDEFVTGYQIKIEEYKFRLEQAESKALQLFKNLFGKKLYNRLVKLGEIWIKGADSLYYRIFWSHHGNVISYEYKTQAQATRAGKEWKPLMAYCGHFGEDYPITDQLIAQILLLQTEPQRFTQQANGVEKEDYPHCGPDNWYKVKLTQAAKSVV